MGSRSRRLLNLSTHSRVANSTASKLRHGPRRWTTSALQRPLIVSASALYEFADAADRRLDSGFGKALGVLDRDILAAAITRVDKEQPEDGFPTQPPGAALKIGVTEKRSIAVVGAGGTGYRDVARDTRENG